MIVKWQKYQLLSGLRIIFSLQEVMFLAYPKMSELPALHAFFNSLGKPHFTLKVQANAKMETIWVNPGIFQVTPGTRRRKVIYIMTFQWCNSVETLY